MAISVDNVNNIKTSIIGLNQSDTNNSKIFDMYLSEAKNKVSGDNTVNDNEFSQNYGVLLCKKLWWDAKLSNNQTLMLSAHNQADEFRKNGATIDFKTSTFVDTAATNYLKYKDTSNYDSGNKIVSTAQKYLNIPYVYGGTNVNSGIDCSYFVQSVFKSLGLNLPRTTYDQINVGKSVDLKDLKAGDVVFFKTDSSQSGPSHVGIYEGNGRMIHASSAHGKVVDVDFFSYIKNVKFYGAKRFA
jgi:cell wall-associated NlpC family hydrolase